MGDISNTINSIMSGGLAIGLVITVVSIIVTIVIIIVAFRWARNISGGGKTARQLLQTGAPAQARILAIQETGMYVNNSPVADIHLEVHPQNGMQPYQTVTRRRISYFEIARYQVGAVIPVRFDPNDPAQVAIAM